MDCHRFEEILFASLDGPLDAGVEQRMQEHAARCRRCHDLETLIAASGPGDALAPGQKLLSGILAKTSGSACERAADRLSERVVATLYQADETLRMHLDACTKCAALDRVLQRLHRDLPSLAEMDPGAGFAAEVLRATVKVPQVVPLWERLVRRPRLALEGAYAGTLALFLVIGVPGSPLWDLGGRALAEVRQEGVRVERALRSGVQELTDASASRWASSAERAVAYLGPCGSALLDELNLKKGLSCWQRAGSELLAKQWQWTIQTVFERLRALWHQLLRYVVDGGREHTQEHEPDNTAR